FLSTKDITDVKKAIDEVLLRFEYSDTLIFDGEPMDKNEFDSFLQSLEVVFNVAKKKQVKNLKNK
ncbi:hypothetical protein JWF52_17820, partial [Clostridium sp. CCUG 7971]|nr:hypothetical protein [Clostridium sp. CCUG 7971]